MRGGDSRAMRPGELRRYRALEGRRAGTGAQSPVELWVRGTSRLEHRIPCTALGPRGRSSKRRLVVHPRAPPPVRADAGCPAAARQPGVLAAGRGRADTGSVSSTSLTGSTRSCARLRAVRSHSSKPRTARPWIGGCACAGVDRHDRGVLAWLGTDDGTVVSAFHEPRSAAAAQRLALGFAAALGGPGES
jgi:hypothetical protein